MEHLLISACLLGAQCRYDGQSKPVLEMVALSEQFDLVPLCPEQLGGLPTPRTPAERIEDRVMTKDGRDVTAEYRHGAEQALHLARLCGCKIALLKERSPSCGSGTIYDGTFTGWAGPSPPGPTSCACCVCRRTCGPCCGKTASRSTARARSGGCSKSMASPWKQCFENQKPANRTVRRFFEVRPCGRTRSPPAWGTSTCRRGYCCARNSPARRI